MKQPPAPKPSRRSSSKAAKAPPIVPSDSRNDGAIAHEEIARLAHSYWEARGCDGGSPEEDWLRAEQELKARGAAAEE